MQVYLYFNIFIVLYSSCAYNNAIPIQRDENGLFCAISYCVYNTEDRHSGMRLSTVNKIINKWKKYKDFTYLTGNN